MKKEQRMDPEKKAKLLNLMKSVYKANSEDELNKKLIVKYRCFVQPNKVVKNA